MVDSPLSRDEVVRIQEMADRGITQSQIAETTGHSLSTINKYVRAPKVEPVETTEQVAQDVPLVPLQQETQTPPVVPVQAQQTKQPEYAKPVQQAQKVQLHEAPTPNPALILPETGVPEPYEWLKNFLEQYAPPLKKGWIILIVDRARIRNDLPSAAQLTDDIQSMESGINKVHHASYIAEIYEHQLREYLARKEREENYYKRPYRGIGGRDRMSYAQGYEGIPMDPYRSSSRPRDRYNESYGGFRADPYYYPHPPRQDDRLARLEDEMRRRDEAERRRFEQELIELKMQIQQGGQQDPNVSRLEAKLEALEDERRRKQEEEMRMLKMQIQQGTGIREQDVRRMIEAERNKITHSDIERMINVAMKDRRSLSEIDLKYKELSDKHNLEVMKLDEKGKTRDTIANAVKTGFSQVGAAIARTASEVGTEDNRKMEGVTDGRNMWQAECPYCGELITAPISAKIIQCPGCNRRLEVSKGEEEKQKPFNLPPAEPKGSEATFSVEQPFTLMEKEETEEEPEIEMPWPKPQKQPVPQQPIQPKPRQIETPIQKSIPDLSYNAQCPNCNTMMKIPYGVKIVECPNCKTRLEVGEPIEDEHTMPMEKEIQYPEDSTPIPIPLTEEEPEQLKIIEKPVETIPEMYSGVKGGEKIEEREVTIEELNKMQEENDKLETEIPAEAEKAVYERTTESTETGTITEPESYVCPECGKEFEKEKSLKGHMLHHIREKKKVEKKKKGKK